MRALCSMSRAQYVNKEFHSKISSKLEVKRHFCNLLEKMLKFCQLRLISSCIKMYLLFHQFIILTSTAQRVFLGNWNMERSWFTDHAEKYGELVISISMTQLLETPQDFHLFIGNACFEIHSITKSITTKAKAENPIWNC